MIQIKSEQMAGLYLDLDLDLNLCDLGLDLESRSVDLTE